MRKSQQFKSLAVVSLDEGREIGRIRNLVINPQTSEVAAIIVQRGGMFGEQKVIPYARVVSVGNNALTVQKMANAERITSLPQILSLVKEDIHLKGVRVISEGGAALGHVEEFYVDTATGKIIAFEVSGMPGDGLLKGKALLPAGEVRTIGKDILIVRDGAEENLTRSESKFAGSMKGIKESTSRIFQKVRDIHALPGGEKAEPQPGPTGSPPEGSPKGRGAPAADREPGSPDALPDGCRVQPQAGGAGSTLERQERGQRKRQPKRGRRQERKQRRRRQGQRPVKPRRQAARGRPRPLRKGYTTARSFEQLAYRQVLVDADDCLSQQGRHGQHLHSGEAGRHRDGVGDHDLLQRRGLDALPGRTGEDRMGAAGVYFPGPMVEQGLRPQGDGTGGVDHVVHDDRRAALHLADDVHDPASLGAGRRLSMMAIGDPTRLAKSRALVTPPTSGETTTTRRQVQALRSNRSGSAPPAGGPPGCRRSPGSARRAGPSSPRGRRPPAVIRLATSFAVIGTRALELAVLPGVAVSRE